MGAASGATRASACPAGRSKLLASRGWPGYASPGDVRPAGGGSGGPAFLSARTRAKAPGAKSSRPASQQGDNFLATRPRPKPAAQPPKFGARRVDPSGRWLSRAEAFRPRTAWRLRSVSGGKGRGPAPHDAVLPLWRRLPAIPEAADRGPLGPVPLVGGSCYGGNRKHVIRAADNSPTLELPLPMSRGARLRPPRKRTGPEVAPILSLSTRARFRHSPAAWPIPHGSVGGRST